MIQNEIGSIQIITVEIPEREMMVSVTHGCIITSSGYLLPIQTEGRFGEWLMHCVEC
jgi:G3E family GTPase